MLPLTAEWLVRMRMNGRKPETVFVEIGEKRSDWFAYRETWGLPVLTVRPGCAVDRLDLRCLVGLNVIVFAKSWSAWVAKLWDGIKGACPDYCALVVEDWCSMDGNDWGLHWQRGMQSDVSMAYAA